MYCIAALFAQTFAQAGDRVFAVHLGNEAGADLRRADRFALVDISTVAEDLEARFALQLEIHADLDALNKDISQARRRDKLQQAVSSHALTGS